MKSISSSDLASLRADAAPFSLPTAIAPDVKWNLIADFTVRGTPAPGGSKTFIPFRGKDKAPIIKNNRVCGTYIDDAAGNTEWRKRVAHSGRVAFQGREPIAAPFMISFLFFFQRPKSHFGTGRNAAILKPDAPKQHEHEQKPDVSKLIRSTEDALTGIVWVDDCHIVLHGPMGKAWHSVSGASIKVWLAESTGQLFGS